MYYTCTYLLYYYYFSSSIKHVLLIIISSQSQTRSPFVLMWHIRMHAVRKHQVRTVRAWCYKEQPRDHNCWLYTSTQLASQLASLLLFISILARQTTVLLLLLLQLNGCPWLHPSHLGPGRQAVGRKLSVDCLVSFLYPYILYIFVRNKKIRLLFRFIDFFLDFGHVKSR